MFVWTSNRSWLTRWGLVIPCCISQWLAVAWSSLTFWCRLQICQERKVIHFRNYTWISFRDVIFPCVFCWGFPRWWERKNLYTEKTICVFLSQTSHFCVHLTCFSLSYVSSLSLCNTKCTGSIGYVYSFDCAYFPLLIVSFRNISPKFWVCGH